VHPWKVTYDKTGVGTHAIERGRGHSLLSPLVAHAFKTLRVSATLWDGYGWWPINSAPSVMPFEDEHGREAERGPYNDRMFAEAKRSKRIVRGEHAGYSDYFVPVMLDKKVVAILAVGPFALARSTSTDILERWRWITGRQGHPTDPEFAAYLSTTLSILVLDARELLALERLLACFAELMGGTGRADALMTRIGLLRAELEPVRKFERAWDVVRQMVDDRSQRTWHGVYHAYELKTLGLPRVADHVLVGLTVNRSAILDPVDEAIRRDGFQRASVDLARAVGGVIAGQVGDHGVVFLSSASGTPQRKKQKLMELSERAAALGRQRFGFSLHFGASVSPESVSLSRSYLAALGAAESALAQGIRIVFADELGSPPGHSLRHLRHELGRAVEEDPSVLGARFDRYLEAVTVQCGYRMESARAHLDVGFEQMTEALLKSVALDQKSYAMLHESLERATASARTLSDLLAAYRRVVVDVSQAVQAPVEAHHDRSLRLAVDYIHQHYTETLSVERVARLAGFSENYFSRLFKKRERKNFADYVCGLRVERAKQLLAGTLLDMRRVAELSGFHSPQYFARVFRRSLGTTPLEFRKAPLVGTAVPSAEKYKQKARKVPRKRKKAPLR
jgi:two-component system, response regulator YesN